MNLIRCISLLVCFTFTNFSHAAKVHELANLVSFVELNNGQTFYSDRDGRVHEVVLKPDGEVVNERLATTLFEASGVKKMIPFLERGAVVYSNNKTIFVIADMELPLAKDVMRDVTMKDMAVVGSNVYALTIDGKLRGHDLVTNLPSAEIVHESLKQGRMIVGVGSYLVLLMANGNLFRISVNERGQPDYDGRTLIGSNWKNAVILPFNDEHIVLCSKRNYVRLRKIPDVTYETVEGSDQKVGYFKQGQKLNAYERYLFQNNGLYSYSASTSKKRSAFLEMPVTVRHSSLSVLVGHSQLYGGFLPQAPFVQDYPKSRYIGIDPWWIAVKVDPAYFLNLPESIRAELTLKNISRESVDMYVVIQRLLSLGEMDDHTDGTPATSRIKAHTWADPDAPSQFKGTRMRRDFHMGIYEPSEGSIQAGVDKHAVAIGALKPFRQSVHDGKISPQTARIQLGKSLVAPEAAPQHFWTLIIDSNRPVSVRAAVTFHGLVSYEQGSDLFNLARETKTAGELIKVLQDVYSTIGDIHANSP